MGIIDDNGVQWEHCSICTQFTRYNLLGYEPPSEQYEHGRDICIDCTNKHPDIESIEPAPGWTAQYG